MGDTLGGLLGAWLPGRTKFGKLCGLLCTFLGSCGCQQVLGQIGSEIFGMLGQLVFGGVSFLANCGDILADSKAANAQADSIQGKSCEEIGASNGFASECVNLPYNRDICVAQYRRYIECKYEDQAEQQNLLTDCQLTCPTEIINAAPTPAPRWPTPTPTSSGVGADAASAGLIAGVVVGVAALAAIAFGAYWFMRAKGGAEPAEPPMIEVEEMAPGPVPVASALPPPPPNGRNFCGACGARLEGAFCGKCGAPMALSEQSLEQERRRAQEQQASQAAAAAPPQQPQTQPAETQQRTVMIRVPPGGGPGMPLQVQTPTGQIVQIVVPAGAGPGSQFQVGY